jgi:hypothetical protein
MVLPVEHEYLDKLAGIVEENLNNSDFGATDLAREMCVSQSTLHRWLVSYLL